MTVSAVDSNAAQVSPAQQRLQIERSSFQQLQKALQSGDLGAAKQAYHALRSSAPNGGPSSNANAFRALAVVGDALTSGDISKAEQAFSAFQQDLRQIGHHSHHQQLPPPDTFNSNVGKATPAFAGDPNLGTKLSVSA